jgi:hypothetical protein
MKRLFVLILALILLLSSAANAKARFGVKAGLNMASAKVSPLDAGVTKKSILGFLFGGMIEAPLSDDNSLAFRGDVSWAEKGVKLTDANGSLKATYDELDFSPFLIYNISGLIDGARPFVQGGPELAFNMSTNQHREDNNGGSATDKEIQNASSTVFSLNLGAGIGLPLNNKGEVVFDLRYCIGLSDAGAKDDATGTIETVKLRSFFINVGYMFPPKK